MICGIFCLIVVVLLVSVLLLHNNVSVVTALVPSIPPRQRQEWLRIQKQHQPYHCSSPADILAASASARETTFSTNNVVFDQDLLDRTNRLFAGYFGYDNGQNVDDEDDDDDDDDDDDENNNNDFSQHSSFTVKVNDEVIPLLMAWSQTESMEGAIKAEQILQHLQEQHQQTTTTKTTPITITRRHYTIVLDAYGKAGSLENVLRILEIMQQKGQTTNPQLSPDHVTLQAVLSAYARLQQQQQKHGGVVNIEEAAMTRLARMESVRNQFHPTTFDYNIVLGLLARSGKAWEAEKIVKRMVDHCNSPPLPYSDHGENNDNDAISFATTTTPTTEPDLTTYNLLLEAHAKSFMQDVNNNNNAQAYKSSSSINNNRKRQRYENDKNFVDNNNNNNNNRSKMSSGERAQEILRELQSLSNQNIISFRPDTRTYTEVIYAIARSYDKKKSSTLPAPPAVSSDIDNNNTDDNDPDDANYNSSDDNFRGNLATRARTLFQECCRGGTQNNNYGNNNNNISTNNSSVRPNKGLYLALLDAYAVSGDPEAAMEAEKILEHLEERGDANQIAYNAVLNALKNSRPPNHLYRAEMILQRMEERKIADKISYTTLIGALAAKGDRASAQRAFDILEKMEQVAATAAAAESASSSTTTTTFETISTNGPNTQTYNAVLHALCQSGEMVKAETLLQKMEEGKCQQGTSPNVFSYATVMNGWARQGGLDKTERLFSALQGRYEGGDVGCRPNLVCYTIFVNACGRTNSRRGAEKAEEALFRLYSEYEATGDNDLKVSVRLASWVIDCWQKSGDNTAGERAEALIDWMLALYDETGDEDYKLNGYAFSSALAAYARSRSLGKVRKAHSLLQRMTELYENGRIVSPPDTFHYTNLINCCAYVENDEAEKQTALQIAIGAYKALENSVTSQPNQITFMSMLTALRNLLPPCKQRTAAVSAIFRTAAREGQVDGQVIHRVQTTLTKKELYELFPKDCVTHDGRVRLNKLPIEWKRNVFKRPQR